MRGVYLVISLRTGNIRLIGFWKTRISSMELKLELEKNQHQKLASKIALYLMANRKNKRKKKILTMVIPVFNSYGQP